MAHLWYSYSAKDYPTNPPTVLSTPIATREAQDAFSIKISMMLKESTGLLSTVRFLLGPTNETFWDDLCDVRKIKGGD